MPAKTVNKRVFVGFDSLRIMPVFFRKIKVQKKVWELRYYLVKLFATSAIVWFMGIKLKLMVFFIFWLS